MLAWLRKKLSRKQQLILKIISFVIMLHILIAAVLFVKPTKQVEKSITLSTIQDTGRKVVFLPLYKSLRQQTGSSSSTHAGNPQSQSAIKKQKSRVLPAAQPHTQHQSKQAQGVAKIASSTKNASPSKPKESKKQQPAKVSISTKMAVVLKSNNKPAPKPENKKTPSKVTSVVKAPESKKNHPALKEEFQAPQPQPIQDQKVKEPSAKNHVVENPPPSPQLQEQKAVPVQEEISQSTTRSTSDTLSPSAPIAPIELALSIGGSAELNNSDEDIMYVGRDEYEIIQMQKHLYKELSRLWKAPKGLTGLEKCDVLVSIDAQGQLQHAEITKGSGSKLYDITVQNNFRKAEYLPIFWGKQVIVTYKGQ